MDVPSNCSGAGETAQEATMLYNTGVASLCQESMQMMGTKETYKTR